MRNYDLEIITLESADTSPLLDLHDFVTTLQRVQNFEDRHERARFHLALGAFGIIALLAGWVELVSHYFLDVDPSQIFFLQSSDYTEYPWLVLSTWLIHIAPFAIVWVFLLRYQTLSNWKTFYIRVGILWTVTMGLAFILNGFRASSSNEEVVYIWAGAVTLAAFLTPFILPETQTITNFQIYFWPMSAISIVWCCITILMEEAIRMGVYATLMGVSLLTVSLVLTWIDQYSFREQFDQFE